jgi:tRNA 2-thiouridine synthesizing protein E
MIKRDQDHFLLSSADWNENLALDLAKESNLVLSQAHWHRIHLWRELYFSYGRHAPTRVFIKALKSENSSASMLELMHLFGERPLYTLSFIAGLPKPPHCI